MYVCVCECDVIKHKVLTYTETITVYLQCRPLTMMFSWNDVVRPVFVVKQTDSWTVDVGQDAARASVIVGTRETPHELATAHVEENFCHNTETLTTQTQAQAVYTCGLLVVLTDMAHSDQ